MVGGDGSEEGYNDDDMDEEDEELDLNPEDFKPSKKHQNYTSMEERAREDMDFRDEVDTPLDMNARDRFSKYRGIKNLKTAEWDAFENLPTHFAKLFRFQNFSQTKKASI